jgi:hypothetical protein
MLPLFVVMGLPFSTSAKVNNGIEKKLLSSLKPYDPHVSNPDLHNTPPNILAEQYREEIITRAGKHGPQGIIAISGSTPVMLAAVRDLDQSVVGKFAGIAGSVDLGDKLPESLDRRLRTDAPALWSYIETYIAEVHPDLRTRVLAPTLSLYSPRDDSVPPEMSMEWADQNVPLWLPRLPFKPERGILHGLTIIKGMHHRVLRTFMQKDLQIVSTV